MATTRGVQNTLVRIENRRALTKLLYTNSALTRQEIIHLLKLSLPTVNSILPQMEQCDLIRYQTSEHSSGGRIPNMVCFNYDAFYAVGIAINQNHYCVLLMNMKCSVVGIIEEDCAFEDGSAYWQTLNRRIDELCLLHAVPREKILGLGIAVPGPAFHKVRQMESWLLNQKTFSVQKLEEIFGLRVVIENDANSAGFAEIWTQSDLESSAYLWVDRGVGGAIIRGGKLVRGQDNLAGEFGHMIVQPNGERCLCGRKGCLDRYCSTLLLREKCHGSLKAFFAEKQSDPALGEFWKSYLQYLAIGISNISIIINEPVIIGGELAAYLHDDFGWLLELLGDLDCFGRDPKLICKLSSVGENSAAIGAALFPVGQYLGIF